METKSQKLFWAENLKFLRTRKKQSQDELAGNLGMTRAKLTSHEHGLSKNPPLEDLIHIAGYFHIAVDTLLKVDLSKLTELKLRELEAGNDVYISGGRIRVLSISVDAHNKENIEYVPVKAKAGYRAGFNDPEYIAQLPKLSLPHLSENKTYRMFPTEGDSMLPIPENSFIITQYVADWTTLNKTLCIVVMQSEQEFLFKIVSSRINENRSLLLHSLNPIYKDQEVFAGDVLEIWEYHSHITNIIPEAGETMNDLLRTVKDIQADVKKLSKSS